MKHADELIERILFLEGLPNLQELGKLLIGENVKEIMECDLKLEMDGVPDLREAIAHCEQVSDYISRELFTEILDSEEEPIDWLDRKTVGSGKSVSVRVDLGGCRSLKKKRKNK